MKVNFSGMLCSIQLRSWYIIISSLANWMWACIVGLKKYIDLIEIVMLLPTFIDYLCWGVTQVYVSTHTHHGSQKMGTCLRPALLRMHWLGKGARLQDKEAAFDILAAAVPMHWTGQGQK